MHLRSPWQWVARALVTVSAAFAVILAAGSWHAGSIDRMLFSVLAAAMLLICWRAFRVAVVLEDEQLVHRGFWTTARIKRCRITDVTASVLNEKFFILSWMPSISTLDGSHDIQLLAGYGRPGRTNSRVERQVEAIKAWAKGS